MKRLLTVFLSVFAVSALVTQFVVSPRTEDKTKIPEGKSLLFFHAEARCPTCVHLEKTVRKLLDDFFRAEKSKSEIVLVPIPYDAPGNREIAERFHVGAVTIILVETGNGQTIRQRDLSHEVWKNIHNDESTTRVLLRNITEFINE